MSEGDKIGMAIIPGEQKIGDAFETPQQRKQKKMIYLFVLTVLMAAVVLYFGFFRVSAPSVEPSLPTGPGTPGGPPAAPAAEAGNGAAKFFGSLKAINLDNPLFKDKKFQGLSLYGEWPISQGVKGRENPFEPY